MANYALVGPFCEGHFADQLWLGPDGAAEAGVFGDFGEGAFVYCDAIEFLLQINAHRVCVAGAGASRVDQFSAIVEAKNQRAEWNSFVRQRVSRDHKLLPLDAFDLQPVATARRLISRLSLFRNNALEPELASFLEKLRAA